MQKKRSSQAVNQNKHSRKVALNQYEKLSLGAPEGRCEREVRYLEQRRRVNLKFCLADFV